MANTQMKNPKTGDVRVVPDELVEQYRERGWENAGTRSAKPAARKRPAAKKTTAKKAAAAASTPTVK